GRCSLAVSFLHSLEQLISGNAIFAEVIFLVTPLVVYAALAGLRIIVGHCDDVATALLAAGASGLAMPGICSKWLMVCVDLDHNRHVAFRLRFCQLILQILGA